MQKIKNKNKKKGLSSHFIHFFFCFLAAQSKGWSGTWHRPHTTDWMLCLLLIIIFFKYKENSIWDSVAEKRKRRWGWREKRERERERERVVIVCCCSTSQKKNNQHTPKVIVKVDVDAVLAFGLSGSIEEQQVVCVPWSDQGRVVGLQTELSALIRIAIS